jgi:ferredoxin-NADP reductase
MATEIFHWMQDLSNYIRFAAKKIVLPKMGQGEDYTNSKHRDQDRSVVERLHPATMNLRVEKVIDETSTTKTFRFVRTDGELPPFRPGQYVNLYVKIGNIATSRPFSISSHSGSKTFDLTVRKKPGGFVSEYLLKELKTGRELVTSGPAGSFYHEPLIDGSDLVFVAGGSGITPFISILRTWKGTPDAPKVHLLYGSRKASDVIFSKELDALARSEAWFSYSPVISEPTKSYEGLSGFLTPELIGKTIGSVDGKMVYVCGPNAMYDLVSAGLEKLGVPGRRVRRELYGPPDDVTKEPGWPKGLKGNAKVTVEIEGGAAFEVSVSEPLINSMERNHAEVRCLCRSGECSYCRVRVVEGTVFMPADTGLRESDRTFGYIHSCVAYPIEDVKIRR